MPSGGFSLARALADTTVLEYLATYRLTLELKCSGPTAEQLAMRSAPPSAMSLIGIDGATGQ